jgi:cobyrinic acid a,c-diamide synthase
MINLTISAIASNQGKTILTTALLYYFKDSVRPFKIGPDFIDPQFHKMICGVDSINLDSFMTNQKQLQWIYNHYSNKEVSILEGVMGFYDGEDRGCSTYGVSKLLNIPTLLILNGAGSYITLSAILKGLLEYKQDNTIKGVILNNLSSNMHYQLIKKQIEHDHKNITVAGWIKKNLPSLTNTHLGLDLDNLSKIEQISREVLENIDMEMVLKIGSTTKPKKILNYPFPEIEKIDKRLAIVNDINFSFLYYDNLQFLKEIFKEVIVIDSTKDEIVPKNCDIVYICGGYVETPKAYLKIKNSYRFKNSLIQHAKTKYIYAECAGLLYLSNRVDRRVMSGILDIEFTLNNHFTRLGYYYNQNGVKGHAFHYTKPTNNTLKKGFDILTKSPNGKGENGSWQTHNGKIFGTYLHIMFRAYYKSALSDMILY